MSETEDYKEYKRSKDKMGQDDKQSNQSGGFRVLDSKSTGAVSACDVIGSNIGTLVCAATNNPGRVLLFRAMM